MTFTIWTLTQTFSQIKYINCSWDLKKFNSKLDRNKIDRFNRRDRRRKRKETIRGEVMLYIVQMLRSQGARSSWMNWEGKKASYKSQLLKESSRIKTKKDLTSQTKTEWPTWDLNLTPPNLRTTNAKSPSTFKEEITSQPDLRFLILQIELFCKDRNWKHWTSMRDFLMSRIRHYCLNWISSPKLMMPSRIHSIGRIESIRWRRLSVEICRRAPIRSDLLLDSRDKCEILRLMLI